MNFKMDFKFGNEVLDNYKGDLEVSNTNTTTTIKNSLDEVLSSAKRILPIDDYTINVSADEGYSINQILLNDTSIPNNSTYKLKFGENLIIKASAVEYTPPVGSPIYGVSWTNDATTTMTRTDDAVEMTYTISDGKVTSDFDHVFPYNQMKRETIFFGEGADDYNIFVYVPAMWFRIKEGTTYTGPNYFDITGVAVSETKGADQPGYRWYQSKAFYYGAYGGVNGTNVSGKLYSDSPYKRGVKDNRDTFRSSSMNVGIGYHQRDLYATTVLTLLWFIEFATKRSQSVMTGANTEELLQTGGTDSIYEETTGADFCVSGYNIYTNQMVWHGIEDFVGNLYEWVDGITVNPSTGEQYVSDNYTLYDDYDGGSNMSQLAFNDPATQNYNILYALGWDITKPFLMRPIHVEATNDPLYAFGSYIGPYKDGSVISYGSSYKNYSDDNVTSGFWGSSNYTGARLMLEIINE